MLVARMQGSTETELRGKKQISKRHTFQIQVTRDSITCLCYLPESEPRTMHCICIYDVLPMPWLGKANSNVYVII